MYIDTETQKVLHLRDEENHTWEEIAKELDFPGEWTARRRYKAGMLMQQAGYLSEQKQVEEIEGELPAPEDIEPALVIADTLPPSDGPIERFIPLYREGDCIITADYHIPLHDPALINSMIETAKANNIKQLIIGGDYWHMEAFGSFLPEQPEASWPIERREGNRVMKTLLRWFDEVDLFIGNHDFRLVKKVGFRHSFQACMEWAFSELTEAEFSQLRISDLDYMYYEPEKAANGGRTYRVCHPTSFSSVPLSVPKKLQPKFSCSMMTAHSHHLSMGFAANGWDHLIELGGFFDKQRTEYIQRTTTNHEWVPGFVMVKDSSPTLHSPVLMNI